ncbi:MAG: GNAT family N-acetyltransferase [Allorhizobium sp.]
MTLDIRDARAEDEAAWRRLWADYLVFYKVEIAEEVTAFTWARILDPQSRLSMRVAIVDGMLAGFATHHFHDSTWSMTPEVYLEDLFLDETFRGEGVGRALIDDLIALARQNGWAGVYWHTQDDNATARKLYDRYVKADNHVRYRLAIT